MRAQHDPTAQGFILIRVLIAPMVDMVIVLVLPVTVRMRTSHAIQRNRAPTCTPVLAIASVSRPEYLSVHHGSFREAGPLTPVTTTEHLVEPDRAHCADGLF